MRVGRRLLLGYDERLLYVHLLVLHQRCLQVRSQHRNDVHDTPDGRIITQSNDNASSWFQLI